MIREPRSVIRYEHSPEVDRAVLDRIQRGMDGFSAEMREKGIHVGLGTPGVCVTCGQAWPCESSGGTEVR